MEYQQLRKETNLKMNNLEKRIKEKFPEENLEVISYKKAILPASIQCKTCGNIYTLQRAESFYLKNKKCVCTNCFNNHTGGRYSLEDIQKRINTIFPKEDLKVLTYSTMKESLTIQCNKCKEIYSYTKAENIFTKNKVSVCKKCFPNKLDIINNKREKVLLFFKENKNFILLDNIMEKHSQDQIAAKCVYCGKVNYKTMNDYLRGRGCSCQTTNTKKTLQQYQSELDDNYEVLEYNGMEHKAKLRHKVCGFIYEKSAKHYHCPRCQRSGSKGEKIISLYLEKRKINFVKQYQVKIENHNLRFDFFVPDLKIFIEFQGIQHYEPVAYFGGEERFKKQQEYDDLKRKYCKHNKFQLLEITYKDLEENLIIQILENTFKVQRPS